MQPPLLSVPDGAPFLVFGGPYSNLQATLALRAEAARLGIPASRALCTGDVVAYGADAAATVAEVRDWGVPVVMGNCEENLGEGAGDCGCGFAEGTACDALSARWYAHADAQLDADARAWMRALPRRIDVALGGRRLAAVHGGVGSINRFLFASAPDAELAEELERADADGIRVDGVLGGHCGLPFTRMVGDRLWHNAGAIGMPANDGTPRVWYALLTALPQGIRVEHRALSYDWRGAQAAMRAARLPEGYAHGLETGLWPSLDVLPDAERAATGVPLAPAAHWWR
ncbi:MAG TPA: metallophosphoesterase family protein [Azospirillaceae bacterium]|nr:metallophosphoesterase family protein [Azospirillaceae bacterium]